MTELLATSIWPFLLGFLLGLLFYGGLWLTVRKVVATKRQPVWLHAGASVRILVTLVGFYIICAAYNQNLVACIAGFVVARFVVLKFVFRWQHTNKFFAHEVITNAPQS